MWAETEPDAVVMVLRSTPIGRSIPPKEWNELTRGYEDLVQRERGRQRVLFVNNDGDLDSSMQQLMEQLRPLLPDRRDDSP